MNPKVKLLTWTAQPVETLYSLWTASRTDGEYLDPWAVARRASEDAAFEQEVLDLFQKMLAMQIPITENVYFTFMLDGVSVSLREQLVRHRIGVRAGERLGCDLIPDMAGSTFWAQSMRILDMGRFADEGRFHVPDSLAGKTVKLLDGNGSVSHSGDAASCYAGFMNACQHFYQALVEAGVPLEDARQVIPLAATHRISWTLSLAALQHIIGKRGCWILQLGLWEPIITGMVRELAEKVHPAFRELVRPGCLDASGEFKGCMFAHDNERRVECLDPLPPCALWLEKVFKPDRKDAGKAWQLDEEVGGPGRWFCPKNPLLTELFIEMCNSYTKLWGRNPFTGGPLNG